MFFYFFPDDALVYETLHRVGILCRNCFAAQSLPGGDYTSSGSFRSGTKDSNVPSE